jgi:hypothetical protein
MAQQTAVEYLMEQLKFTNKEAYAELHCNGEFEKAQQMFKEQTEMAFAKSYLIGVECVTYDDANKASEQYYNETYNW